MFWVLKRTHLDSSFDTHNICFGLEIRKIMYLSGGLNYDTSQEMRIHVNLFVDLN